MVVGLDWIELTLEIEDYRSSSVRVCVVWMCWMHFMRGITAGEKKVGKRWFVEQMQELKDGKRGSQDQTQHSTTTLNNNNNNNNIIITSDRKLSTSIVHPRAVFTVVLKTGHWIWPWLLLTVVIVAAATATIHWKSFCFIPSHSNVYKSTTMKHTQALCLFVLFVYVSMSTSLVCVCVCHHYLTLSSLSFFFFFFFVLDSVYSIA